MSEDLRAFFLIEFSGAMQEQHKRFLRPRRTTAPGNKSSRPCRPRCVSNVPLDNATVDILPLVPVISHDRRRAGPLYIDSEPPIFDSWRDVPIVFRFAAIRIHQQCLHSSSCRSRRASPQMRAMRSGCSTSCSSVAVVSRCMRFNQGVGTDFAFMPDMRERQHYPLVVMDVASDFTLAK